MADDLLSKLERAEGADRKGDVALWLKFGHLWPVEDDDDLSIMANEPLPPSVRINGLTMFEAVERYPNDIRIPSHYNVPRFTSSLDAALALVERVLPGTEWAVSTLYGKCHAEVNMNAEEPATAQAATIPLALCIALLSASQAKEQAP